MPHEQVADQWNVDAGSVEKILRDFKAVEAQARRQAPDASRVRTDRDGEAVQGRNDDHRVMAEEKSYLVETDDGIFRITVPADWLITFGPMYVSTKQTKFNPSGGAIVPTALRFYEGKHQRACMLNVTNFHDLSIKIEPVKMEKGEWINAIN